MKIGDREYEAIIITDEDDCVLGVIDDELIIEQDGIKAVCVPIDD